MAVTKKEGGNLMARDFTDDIYEKNFEERWFVPDSSEMFVNLLVAMPIVKRDEFRMNYSQMVEDYYNEIETKQLNQLVNVDYIKNVIKDIKENKPDKWKALCAEVNGGDPDVPLTDSTNELITFAVKRELK